MTDEVNDRLGDPAMSRARRCWFRVSRCLGWPLQRAADRLRRFRDGWLFAMHYGRPRR